jgi:hypothetical protein
VPVTITYVDSELGGRLIVSKLTDLIAYEIQDVIDFRRIEQEAREEAARLRQKLTRKECTIETAASAEGTRSAAPERTGARSTMTSNSSGADQDDAR